MRRLINPVSARIFIALAALSAIGVQGAPGDADYAFVASDNDICFNHNASLTPADSGAIYLTCAARGDWKVIKFRADGTRDTRWGNAGVARKQLIGLSDDIHYAGVDPDGGFRTLTRDGRTLRFRPDGSADPDFAKLNGNESVAFFMTPGTYGQQVQILSNFSSQTLPDGSMVTLSYAVSTTPVTFVVRKLPADGNSDFPIPEIRYGLPNSDENLFGNPVAWSLSADDSLEVLMFGFPKVNGSYQFTGDLRLYRAMPNAVAVLQPGRTFPVRGIANVSRGLRVFGDSSKLLVRDLVVAKWLPDNRRDPDFGDATVDGAVVPNRNLYCDFDNVSLIANGGFVLYYRQGEFHGSKIPPSCRDLNASPRLANGRVDPGLPAAWSPFGELKYTAFVAQDGGIVTLRYSDMRLQRFQGYGPRADIAVVEYYHAGLDHYFITATQPEIDDLDNAPASGWKRTGHRFGAWNIDTPMPNTETVCRYYGDRTAGPNSHFYSAEKFECDDLSKQEAVTPAGRRAWRFERNGFRVTVPVAGKCPEALVPVRRLYNNAGPGKDPNHRYLTSDSELQAMLAKGWVDEGVHMCATSNPQ